ncbi:TPA: PIN domain nuclease [bacterium]|nr:PIN domain nuclease [bacterium]
MNYVLDSWAVIAYFNKEPEGNKVRDKLLEAREGKIKIYMHLINLFEVYYILCRKVGEDKAKRLIGWFKRCPVSFIGLEDDILFSAGRIKARFPISYADSFAVATAIEYKCKILTSDPEFKKTEELVKVEWL